MSKHYIYEIFGKKIGATNDMERRMKQQGVKEGEYRIIEEHSNAKTCSIREIELQREFNYPVDRIQYWKTLNCQKKATTKKARKKAVANTDFKAFQAKRVASRDWKAFSANVDWEVKANKTKKPINQYDLEGNFIKRWDSAIDVAIQLNFNKSDIGSCCRGEQKTSKKSIWKYA